MFKTRLISGIILVAAALVFIMTGGILLWAVMLAVSVIGLYEFYNAVRLWGDKLSFLGFAALLAYYILLLFTKPDRALSLTVVGLMILLLIFLVATFPAYQISQLSVVMLGVVYVPVMLSFIYLTRMLPHGRCHVWLIFLATWGCDTLAYCTGMLIGKHKMTPILSPKKTIEGGIGGVLGAALLGVIYGAIMHAAARVSCIGAEPGILRYPRFERGSPEVSRYIMTWLRSQYTNTAEPMFSPPESGRLWHFSLMRSAIASFV